MLTYILIGLAVLIVGFLLAASFQPNSFRYTRTALFKAPPEVVFPQINDLHNWNAWSPWARMDPNATNGYSGPESGVGASFTWDGKKVGSGKMTVTDSRPVEFVQFRLEFFKPFTATNTAEFKLQREGDSTRVTWSMFGPNKFIGKVMGLLMNCDKMCGTQFEQGFENLRGIVEPVAVA